MREGSPATAELDSARLVLTPLRPTDAGEMVDVLADRDLYAFTGGIPPSLAQLESRYQSQVAGLSTGDEVWHNWIIRLRQSGTAVGFVQATVVDDTADIAWVAGVRWQGQGIATEAAAAMCDWLSSQGVDRFTAHIHPQHAASGGVAASLELRPTDDIDAEGEVVWSSLPSRLA
jgi:RimJ/RimL family protein N-acetyltransferase